MIKKFNLTVVFFLIPIALTSIMAEFLLRNIPNDHKFKANYMATQSDNIETLIIGNSHTMYGLNPEYINGNAFNVSNVSQTIDVDFEILKKYKSQMPNLKTIILRLSYTTLYEKLYNTTENWRLKDYTIYYDLPIENSMIHHSEILSVKWKTNLNRASNYYFFNKTEQKCDSLGWGTDAASYYSKDLIKTGISTAKKHTAHNKNQVSENLQTLKAIIEFCANHNIEVILVTLPAYKSYSENLEFEQLKTTINTGNLMQDIYANCKYYNFLNFDKFVADDFFDADHLNEKGAKKFSLLINSLLNH